MKSIILSFLLSLWLTAIIAPSVITLLERDGKIMVMTNMNEEEHQEQGKKEIDEKKLVLCDYCPPNFITSSHHITSNNLQEEHIPNFNLDILLPPPKSRV
ncbi:hypothetical protein OO010_08570 [Flavobacteriaceae bacterium KMM 6898]|nr:hypothetical protein [Flavobacteriaceae bacterium KMM 6898]